MTLSITLYDQNNTPLPKAGLKIRYQMPNKKWWESEALRANANGVLSYPMEPKFFRQINFSKAQYFIEYQGQKYTARPSTLPSQTDKRLHLHAEKLNTSLKDVPDPVKIKKPVTGPQSALLLKITVMVSPNKPLAKTPLRLTSKAGGNDNSLDLGSTDTKGYLEHTTTMATFAAITAAKPVLSNPKTGKTYDVLNTSAKPVKPGVVELNWMVNAAGLDPAEDPKEPVAPPNPAARQEIKIFGTLIEGGQPVAKRTFGLSWSRRDGMQQDIPLPGTDDNGRFLWQGSLATAVEAALFQAKLYDDKTNTIYDIEKTEDSIAKGTELHFTWHIRKTDEQVIEPPDLQGGDHGLVSGTVTTTSGVPQARLVIRAFDVDFPKEQELGFAETDDDGFYAINYAAGTAKQREKDVLDIVVRAYPPGNRNAKDAKPLVESQLYQKAPLKLNANLVTGAREWLGASLFERIFEAVVPMIKGVSVRKLTPAAIALLAVRTRYTPKELGRFFAAWRLALLAGISEDEDPNAAAPFFGWLTDGLPAHPVALALQPIEKLRLSIEHAVNANWIPKGDYSSVLEAAKAARAAIIAEHQPELIEYLKAGGFNDSQARQVIGVFLEGYDLKEREEALIDALGRPRGERTLELIEIWQAIGGNTHLGIAILENGKTQVPRDLVELTRNELAQLAKSAKSVPDYVAGAGLQARAAAYSTDLVNAIENRYPFAYFAHQLTLSTYGETKRLGNRLKTSLAMQPPRAGAADPVITGGWDQELVDLASLYASAVPERRAPLVDQLIREKYMKAPDINEKGRTNFRERMASKIARVGEKADADVIFTRAQFLVSVANAVKMQEITEQAPGEGAPATLSRQLFQGSVNGACPQCKSMTGPSAYLLDLVRYSSRASVGKTKTGWDRVDIRRPDLKNIDLTCANSDTEMPYIDLVLELLEDQVVPWTGPPRQTLASSEELAERPYYVNDKAYRTLKRKSFPWAARYNRAFDLTRRALAQTGLPLPSLLDATGTGDAAWLDLWDGTLFKLETTGAKVAAAFGVSSLANLRKIASLGALAQHLQIELNDLLDMFSSAYVNPTGVPLVSQGGLLDWARMPAALLGRLALLGQLHAQTDMDLGALEHWLRIANPTNADWQADFAAALRMQARDHITASDIAALIGLDDATRLSELADIAGVSPKIMTAIDADTQLPSDLPGGMDALMQIAGQLSDGGKRDTDLILALISAPETGGLFDPVDAATVLNDVTKIHAEGFADATGLPSAQELLLVAETLAAGLNADVAMIRLLLPDSGLIQALRSRNADAEQVLRLWKQARAATLLALDSEDVLALPELVQKFGILDISALPSGPGKGPGLAKIAALIALSDMNAQLYRHEGSLFVRLAGATRQLGSLRKALALPGLAAPAITALLGADALGLSATSDLFDAGRIARLTYLLNACRKLKTDGATLLKTITGFDDALAWQFARDSSSDRAWPAAARQISDPLRERCRDALLAEVTNASRSGPGDRFDEPHDVYAHFLIDPEMMAVVDTSRIKQASASLQQFVQRVQLGLEPGVVFSQNDASQWAWRRNYRVWEANRKVMVFPENWVRPELRDNKTALYRQLESDLLKNEVRPETAEDALLTFARGLHEVAGLEMAAMYKDDDTGTTYVLGRTREMPHSYYFNSRGPNALWMGWEKVDIEIAGDHIIPVVYARRIFLAWVTFETKVAVEDNVYVNRISTLEHEQNIVRDEIDSIKRKIDEAARKKDENAEYLDKYRDSEPMGLVYQQLDQIYTDILESLQGADGDGGQLQVQRNEEKRIIEDTNNLKNRYTYCEATLSLSQRRRGGGWEPIKKSASTVRTILENDGLFSWMNDGDTTIFYEDIDSFYVKVNVDGQDLTFTLCRSYDKDEDEHNEQIFGWFFLDVANNVLTATEQYSSNNRLKSSILQNGEVTRQTITLKTGEETLTVLDNGAQRLLGQVKTSIARAVPYQYAAGTSLLFEQGKRSYLIEKASTFPNTHAGPDMQSAGREIARTEGAGTDLLDPVANVPGVALAGDDGWRFTPLYHPFSEVIVTELYRYGLDGLYLPDVASGQKNANMLMRQRARRENFTELFSPTNQVAEPRPVEAFNFARTNPYGVYNWELFFHAPYAIAEHLRQNRRFEDARRWYHFIFNPTDKDEHSLAAVWRFGPFFKEHQRILAGDTPDLMDDATNPDFAGQVEEWEKNPFNPHAVARIRTVAYMRAIFMGYLENLMDWGDDLFRRDTMESINEAAQLYVFAAEMLGPKPTILPDIDDETPPKSVAEALSWAPSMERILASAGNVQPHPDNRAIGSAFFDLFGDFCMPSNDKLMGIWTRLEDRLFKIRHSLNIEGTFRKLALYQAPIDPALLVKAAASGLSIADAVSGLSSKRPNYRFTFMVAKALEFTGDVRALGASLLSGLEKRDVEALSLLRASHETAMNKQMRDVFKDRIKEAKFAIAGIDAELTRMVSEEIHYDALIAMGDLPEEAEEAEKLAQAQFSNMSASTFHALSSILSAIPQIGMAGPAPKWGYGGLHAANIFRAFGDIQNMFASQYTYSASMSGRRAGRIRRDQDWIRAKESAAQTLKKLQQNMLAAEIRMAIAEKDLEQHDLRITQSMESETFLMDKFTGEALYSWMVDRLSGLHFQAYKLASDLARQAEVCFRDELSDDSASFIDPGAWDSMRKGLLAGQHLTLDLRRMEAAYLAANKRVHELIKSVSLAQLDPLALMALRNTGTCRFSLPEYIFDLDHAGHVNRRIKSVNVTIPALAGPQTSIACTLSLAESQLRRLDSDGTFTLRAGRSGEAVATSTGQNDSGMFQFDFKDPRYLKFEGAGAISTWDVSLPDPEVAQFDFGSITDLIVQIHYTAEDGLPDYVEQVKSSLRGALDDLGHQGQAMFSLRYDFPETWARLKNDDSLRDINLALSAGKFPYLFAKRSITLANLSFFSVASKTADVVTHDEALRDVSAGDVSLTLPGEMRDALSNSARDVIIIAQFSAGPV